MRVKIAAMIMLIVAGCESRDERLVNFAERAVESQQRQNELIARQSEQVVLESRDLAAAAKEVVTADAQARQELVAAQREFNLGLQVERAGVNHQRDQLEAERRAIADRRARDPIVAAAVQTIGLLLICILPLIVAAYALRQMNRPVDDGAELGNLLIEELTGDSPLLLPQPGRPLLTATVPADDGDRRNEPPF